jgi:peptidase E
MRVYQISYYGMDDNIYKEFFTSKIKAQKRHKLLSSKVYIPTSDDLDEDEDYTSEAKQVFDICPFNVDISKKGILKMLNSRFREQ